MERSLEIGIDTSFALNLLIYIQNIYLNQHEKGEKLRFPYLSTKVVFRDDFEIKYKELWKEISQRIAEDNKKGAIPFYGDKELYYEKLFVIDGDSSKEFNEIYQTFKVWWGSFVGHFTIEKSTDEMAQQLYTELANLLVQKGIKPKRRWNISLLYDECLLAETQVFSYFAVVPTRDFFIKYKELVSKLEACMDLRGK
ncbi:hypothetical protein [Oceanobacillus sp. Castelsardo]|uniref:hypothetical protein n=1 Tax=Oceanobacillus sp. Castelsardo TaxID=1851204 RepID=UPI0009ED753E|nr:hypothetical protein [Oceanobacillus sp. Castelsardo]